MGIGIKPFAKSFVTALVVTGVMALVMPLFGVDDYRTLAMTFVGVAVLLSAYEALFNTNA